MFGHSNYGLWTIAISNTENTEVSIFFTDQRSTLDHIYKINRSLVPGLHV